MAEFVGAAAIEVGKCIVEPIKRQFNYLCCFSTNIQNLRDEAKKLEDAKVGVKGQVDAARRNNEVIVPQVETWLDDVNKIQESMSAIEFEIQNVKSGCLAIKSRFSLSKKATKMDVSMKELLEDGKFGQISHLAPPAARASIPTGQTYELESRKHVEEDIMAALREKKVRMMGICGMGGVGKTTMAKIIMGRARSEGLFEEIVMVVVSQPIDMLRIQQEMAEFLGLKLEFGSLAARAHHLRARLMNTKSILIILDDLWKGLDLEVVGIPDHGEMNECMLLLTSRNVDVFSSMNVDKTFQIKILSEKEAWSLFKEKNGVCVDDPSLFPTAQEIVQECRGLPIALVTVGVALKGKKNKSIWVDAVQELRSCNPRDIPDFLGQVYNPLKLSYDLLESEHAKSIFLLCCLFPEDSDISTYYLSLYGWGLGMFEGITSLLGAWHKVQTLVEILKSQSLLLDGKNEGSTKMHDVVRDVGIFIATKEGLMDPNLSWKIWPMEESNHIIDCTWISYFGAQKITFLEGSDFPNLRFLLVEGPTMNTEELPLHDNFFESARKLNVLSIENYGLRSLSHTIRLLKSLRTLILCSCYYLEDVSVVGELVSLEILYCQRCSPVKKLPVEIGRLTQLKLLHISDCVFLRTVAAGVISRLIRLEELTLTNCFNEWELTMEEGKNAALCELNSLPSLTRLRIEAKDASLAAENIHLSPNLLEFDITIGYKRIVLSSYVRYVRKISLTLERDIILGDWIHQLIRRTDSLVLYGECSSKLVPLLLKFQSLKQLIFMNAKMTRLIDGRSSGPTNTFFPLLENLTLEGIDDLEEICKGPISSSSFNNLQIIRLERLPKLQHLKNVLPHFCNICDIRIEGCGSLRTLFPWAIGRNYLLQLKSLVIRSCSMLEQVVVWDEEENGQSCHLTFPKLGNLFLENLPRLTSLCKGIDKTEFPALTRMSIVKCPNLKSLASSAENDHKMCGNETSLHLFCKPHQAAFGRLKSLEIGGYDSINNLWCDQIPIDFFTRLDYLNVFECNNINSLCSYSIAKYLVNLRILSVESCPEMVKVIEEEEVIERSPFIKLEELRLCRLTRLNFFCDWRCALQLPSLRSVCISECHLMERFPFDVSTSQICPYSFENLESVEVRSCSMLEQVVLWNEEENGNDTKGQTSRYHRCITFPKLKTLHVDDLPRLNSFCKGVQSIEFPVLAQMKIVKCQSLKSVISSTESEQNCSGDVNHDAEGSLHLFCKSEATFGKLIVLGIDGYESVSSLWCDQIPIGLFTKLVYLTVSNCGNIKILFSLSIAVSLVNLTDLSIKSCCEMVQVIEDKEDDQVEMSLFIKLERINLEKLPNLKAFCDWRCALHLPSLAQVDISECPEMERFSCGSLTTPNLEYIEKEWICISDYTKDLNDALGDFLHLDILFGGD